MKPTSLRMVQKADGTQGYPGFWPPGFRPDYKAYKSPHGPSYKQGLNFHGFSRHSIKHVMMTGGPFAVAFGVMGLFFVSDVPKVRHDILQKLPVVGTYFKREVAPEDNPF